MGDPDVISIHFMPFIGVGIHCRKYNAFEVGILLPFISISIYFHKDKHNKWFSKI